MNTPTDRDTAPERSARIRVAAAVVSREGRILLTRRPPGGAHPLMWEFPGGKIERGESPEQALVRELREELGVEAKTREILASHRHDYPGGPAVEVVFVSCELLGEPAPSDAVHEMRWVEPQAIELEQVLAADRPFLMTLGARG